jgi:hypothetical protein
MIDRVRQHIKLVPFWSELRSVIFSPRHCSRIRLNYHGEREMMLRGPRYYQQAKSTTEVNPSMDIYQRLKLHYAYIQSPSAPDSL